MDGWIINGWMDNINGWMMNVCVSEWMDGWMMNEWMMNESI